MGTSLQIRPCRDLPRKTKKNKGKIVIVNLQKTSLDSLADLLIHERCDYVMKYILEKLQLNSKDKYSHVKKIILLSGKTKSGKDFLAKKLMENIPALLLRINKSNEEDSIKTCQRMLEENDQLCSTNSIWIIDDVKSSEEIEFFRKIFDQRLVLVRIQASDEIRKKRGWNAQEDIDQLETNIQWSFVFLNNEEENFKEQMTSLMEMINSFL